MPAAAVQVPIGIGDGVKGVVDLVYWRAIYNEGQKGIDVKVSDEIPVDVLDLAKEKRTELIEQLAEVDEEIGDFVLNDEQPSNDQIAAAICRSTIGLEFSPVFLGQVLGSAIRNTAVQPFLDGVCAYLPNPSELDVVAHDTNLYVTAPPVPGLAFKLEEGCFSQLSYMRVYQGSLKSRISSTMRGLERRLKSLALFIYMVMKCRYRLDRSRRDLRHFGVDCSSGDTFTDGSTSFSMVSKISQTLQRLRKRCAIYRRKSTHVLV